MQANYMRCIINDELLDSLNFVIFFKKKKYYKYNYSVLIIKQFLQFYF